MTNEEAAKILEWMLLSDATEEELYSLGRYLSAYPERTGHSDHPTACLDGYFTSNELMAISIWMKEPAAVIGFMKRESSGDD